MNNSLLWMGLLIPLAGTVLGSAVVFLIKGGISLRLQKIFLGFAAGVMIAASVWSLLIPAIEMAEQRGVPGWLPSAVGFLLGVGFLLLLDCIIPHLHAGTGKPEGPASALEKSTMLILAVTLHNLPEGMAVGVVLAAAMAEGAVIPAAAALSLCLGIALQNFPEGAVISTPLVASKMSRRKAFLYGAASGVVEPIGALLTMLLTSLIVPVLPYILSFAAGAMIYVVIEELIPDAQTGEHSNTGTISAAFGFVLMMILDVALG